MENRNFVILIIRVICSTSFAWLAATTGYTVAQAAKGWGNQWLIGMAILVMFALVDAYSQNLGKFAIRGFIDKSFRNDIGTLTFIIVLMLFAGRFTASTFMTYIASKPLAESISPPPDTQADQAAIEKAQSARNNNLDALREEKERLERSEAKRVRDAKRAGEKLVDDAINAGGANFARLYRAGNDWVKTDRKFRKTREAIKAARVQADGLIFIEKEATRAAQSAYIAALGSKDEVTGALASVMKTKSDRYNSKVDRYTITLYLIDFAAAILAIITLIAIVKYEVKTNSQYKSIFTAVFARVTEKVQSDVVSVTEKTSLAGWELIFTGITKLPTLLRWLNIVFWVKFIGMIERVLKVDIDGNGNIGNQKTPTATSVEPPTNQPTERPIIGGFVLNKSKQKAPTNSAQKIGGFSPTLPTQNRPKSADVGVTPTTPTNPPTMQQLGSAQKSVEASEEVPTKTPTKKSVERREAPTKNRAAGDKDLDRMYDAARAAFKRYIADSDNEKLFATWKEWEATLKRNGFTVSRSPSGTKVTIIKPKARKK